MSNSDDQAIQRVKLERRRCWWTALALAVVGAVAMVGGAGFAMVSGVEGDEATAAGVAIDPEAAPGMWHQVTTFVNRSSMLQDMSAGRPTEIDAINGAVAREGARLPF